jgi:hypothetical protein
MNNDDLEKKIAEIIDSSVDDWATRDRRGRIQVHVSTIADILVKSGLKFDTVVSHTATFDLLQQNRINELEKRIAEAEHRAEVAERALKKLASFFAHNAKFLKDEREKERYQKTIFDDWINQAEEELAEGKKDKGEVKE